MQRVALGYGIFAVLVVVVELMALRRAATLVGSASAVGAAALGGSSAKAEAAPKYGWEGAVPTYGGAGDVKPGKNTKKVVTYQTYEHGSLSSQDSILERIKTVTVTTVVE